MKIEPEPTTPRSTRAVRARRGAAAAFAALAGAALLSACGSSSSSSTTNSGGAKGNLDTARIALSIEQSILAQRHIHAKVTCPAAIPQETGKTFTCIATNTTTVTPHGGKPTKTTVTTNFTVTVQNNRGYVTYHS
jgi:hypothetical protein